MTIQQRVRILRILSQPDHSHVCFACSIVQIRFEIPKPLCNILTVAPLFELWVQQLDPASIVNQIFFACMSCPDANHKIAELNGSKLMSRTVPDDAG